MCWPWRVIANRWKPCWRNTRNNCAGCADSTFLNDRRKVLAAAQAIGGVNLLINAAGINHFAMLEQLDENEINGMLALNITAPICLTKLLLPMLKQAASAMVVNVGSTYGSIGYPGYATYCATKFALRGFSEACAGNWPIRGSACCTSRRVPPTRA